MATTWSPVPHTLPPLSCLLLCLALCSPLAHARSLLQATGPGAAPSEVSLARAGGLPDTEGPFTAVSTAAQLRQVLRNPTAARIRVGLPAGAVLQPCSPFEFGPNQQVDVICNGATLDLSCANADIVVQEGTNVTMFGCHNIYPSERGVTDRAFEPNELVQNQG